MSDDDDGLFYRGLFYGLLVSFPFWGVVYVVVRYLWIIEAKGVLSPSKPTRPQGLQQRKVIR